MSRLRDLSLVRLAVGPLSRAAELELGCGEASLSRGSESLGASAGETAAAAAVEVTALRQIDADEGIDDRSFGTVEWIWLGEVLPTAVVVGGGEAYWVLPAAHSSRYERFVMQVVSH